MSEPAATPALRRHLGLFSCIMVTVGAVIGSGVFFKPLEICKALPDPAWILGTWIAVGLVSLAGALSYGELGAMFPEAGGQYAYIREGTGRFPAFLYGWCLFWIINPGTMAALAQALGDNLDKAAHIGENGKLAVAIGMIVFVAAVNHLGVRFGSLLQDISTLAKLAALAALIVGGVLVSITHGAAGAVALPAPLPPPKDLVAGLVAACVAIFWAYEGWNQLPFNAAEIKRPDRDLPRGLVYGTLILILVYVTVNAVYFRLIPYEEMRGLPKKEDIPMLSADRIFGSGAGTWILVLIGISVFGASNTNMLSAPRGLFAMAQDGLMPRALLTIHARHRTPVVAIWVQAALAIATVLIFRDFTDITDYVIFAALIFYALTVASVYVLRKKAPGRERPYRCFGYPVTPALFIAVALFVDVWTLLSETGRANALKGLAIILAGVPVFFVAESLRRKRMVRASRGDAGR